MPNAGHRLHADEDLLSGAVSSGGSALAPHVRTDMESRFGQDFSDVRVHTDSTAHDAATAVHAQAYTVGPDIVFQRGNYDPGSSSGQQLLAHELTHVVQQRSGPVSGTDTGAGFAVSDPDDRFEREAAATASMVTSTDSLLGLQRLAGNQAVGRYLQRCGSTPPDQCGCHDDAQTVVQRQPMPPEVDRPHNLGPPVDELPLPPIISVGRKDGRWFWQIENIPDLPVDSTPEMPFDPRDIPDVLREHLEGMFRRDAGLPPNIPRTRLDPEFMRVWITNMCNRPDARLNPLCLRPAPAPPSPAGPMPSLGVLWTDRVTFLRDRPTPGTAGGLTPEGRSSVNDIISWLRIDPNLRVRLIGHTSSEGTPEHNQALSTRRVAHVEQALRAAGFADRIEDPIISDGKESGCQNTGPGRWSCGDTKAAEEPDPADRVVEVSFFRALNLTLTPPSILTPP